MNYKVTIIIPCYNAENTIIRSVDSVKAQTIGFSNLELIVVDDSSTDSSFQKVCNWAEGFKNVTCLRTGCPSGSPGPPRDMGLEAATASFIMFLDSDDTFEKDAVEVLYKAIETSDYDVVVGNYIICSPEGKKTVAIPGERDQDFDFSSLKKDHPAIGHFWSAIYRKNIIQEQNVRFLNGYSGQDIFFQLQYYMSAKKGKYLCHPIVKYYESNSSRAHNLNTKYYVKTAESYKIIYQLYQEKGKEIIPGYPNIDYIFYSMLHNMELNQSDREKILFLWWDNLQYIAKQDYHSWYAGFNILLKDAQIGELSMVMEDAEAIADFEEKRKEEMEAIYSSWSWKLAQIIQKAIGKV